VCVPPVLPAVSAPEYQSVMHARHRKKGLRTPFEPDESPLLTCCSAMYQESRTTTTNSLKRSAASQSGPTTFHRKDGISCRRTASRTAPVGNVATAKKSDERSDEQACNEDHIHGALQVLHL